MALKDGMKSVSKALAHRAKTESKWKLESAPYWSSDETAFWEPSTATATISTSSGTVVSSVWTTSAKGWAPATSSSTPSIFVGGPITSGGTITGRWTTSGTLYWDEWDDLTVEQRKLVEEVVGEYVAVHA